MRDDGKGIDQEVLGTGSRAGHYGLPGMSERAKALGRKLEVRSKILPYYSTLHEGLLPNSFRCQEKNI